ncbi:MAG: carboxypeptidase-like regulatory domain-containing protein [Salinivirgaceae bacterium]|nr:carboxypeptidase-like regulatory domain-containing protein [Salinivirgaceae bacterium]
METFKRIKLTLAVALIFVFAINATFAIDSYNFKKDKDIDENENYQSFQGRVVDEESSKPLVFATVGIEGTNIATVTNTDGKFLIKVPNDKVAGNLKIAYMGYESKTIAISDLKNHGSVNTIKLKMVSVKLTEINVFPNNPRLIIDKVLENRRFNYSFEPQLMKAFYRETIKRRRAYVGLSEAVVEVYKQSYGSYKNDQVKLFKGRKSEDVKKMDTLLFKLQGGPISTLMLDIVKDPYLVLDNDVLDKYEYTYKSITRVDGNLNYVIEFKQNPYVLTPLFYGSIYIDVESFAITSISFNLNTQDKDQVSSMFIKKKPFGVSVYPTSANYLVNYREKDGKWFFSYSRGEVNFDVKWKKRLFKTNFSTMIEMAITDWDKATEKQFQSSDRLRMNVVMSDAVTGFTDKDFWGEYNTIEPDQSIESAIKKIKKNIGK